MKRIVTKLIRGERGQALIIVMILLLMGGLIIAPLLGYMGTGLIVGRVHEERMDELYAADSGVEDAIWQIINKAAQLPQSTDDDPWVYSIADVNGKGVSVSIEYIDEKTYKITSTATTEDSNSSTTIESYVKRVASILDYAVVALSGDITISGNTDIDSYPEPNQANIYANGDIELEGKAAAVHGDATATGSIFDKHNGITGVKTEGLDPPLEFSKIDTSIYENEANNGELIEGDLVIKTSRTLGPARITGNLTLTSSAVLTLGGTVWVDGEITTDGSISIEGAGPLVAVGNIQVSGRGVLAPEKMPVIISTEGNITTAGNRTIAAVLYAPNGTIDVSGGAGVFGAMTGKEVIISTSCTQAYATEVVARVGVGRIKILTWDINLQ